MESREWWADLKEQLGRMKRKKKAMRALEVFKDGREQGKGSKRYP